MEEIVADYAWMLKGKQREEEIKNERLLSFRILQNP